ncbi:MAG TPA: uroporphyrinogen decarboxylase, partial [Candidatus Didemnitutus sp.]|nr:uroporphyrinogen decarboxylase [Candidatus Didemnitutus sp.]
RPPVWIMRQAGRFLPKYRELQERYPFFTRIRTPELASQISRMPVDVLGVDAAIIFSDILVVPDALGCPVTMEAGAGPRLPHPIRTMHDVEQLVRLPAAESLGYVSDAIRLTRSELSDSVPVIGFAGAPWTILCYMVEGKGSKDWELAKRFLLEQPQAASRLLDLITDQTIDYLRMQHQAGASAVQVFDSWAAALSPSMYQTWMMPLWTRIVSSLADIPLIVYARGAHVGIDNIASLGSVAVGLDWSIEAAQARMLVPSHTLQGNLDPVMLFADHDTIRKTTIQLIHDLGVQRTIINLGHGILPTTPVDAARVFIDTVKNYT